MTSGGIALVRLEGRGGGRGGLCAPAAGRAPPCPGAPSHPIRSLATSVAMWWPGNESRVKVGGVGYRRRRSTSCSRRTLSKAVDHVPSRTFYLWHAKVISVSTKFLANVMEAALWALSKSNHQNVTAPRARGAGGPGPRPGGDPAQQGERRAQHSRSPSTRASWSTSLARIST